MSFWKSLLGAGGSIVSPSASSPAEDYKGFTIRATPMQMGSEFQLAGEISKQIDGALKVHKFVRADRLGSREDAVTFALAKARLIVDEQGETMFAQDWPKPG